MASERGKWHDIAEEMAKKLNHLLDENKEKFERYRELNRKDGAIFLNGEAKAYEAWKSTSEYKELQDLKASSEVKEINAEMSRIIRKFGQYNRQVIDAVNHPEKTDWEKLFEEDKADSYWTYKRIAGEVEARNASKRQWMDAGEKREKMLSDTADVGEEDRIFIERGLNDKYEIGNMKYEMGEEAYYQIPFEEGLKRVVDPAQKENRAPVFVSETPEVLQKIGFTALPMMMNARHLRLNYYTQAEFEANYGKMRTQEHAHGLHDKLQSLPKALEHPLAVVANLTRNAKPGSVVAITDMNINGKKVVVPVLIETESTGDGERIDSHLVLTVYDSNDWVNDFLVPALEEEKNGIGVFYFDKEKANRYSALSKKEGSIPTGFVHNIAQSEINVKPQTETLQFKKWFGDSKVVDEDGNPLVVYRREIFLFCLT